MSNKDSPTPQKVGAAQQRLAHPEDLTEQTAAGVHRGLPWGLVLPHALSWLPSPYTCEVHSIIPMLKLRKLKVK